ncbi:OmpA family protein [Spirosoma utsteinense]|uniref:Outer membrane protein OmpA-like peptidoglycan-associated protein n=1 Tax=Spirosoma utsteinense TaxID=2585773 RepID=A0ABR6W0J2_9BACT|nr:OmpA family protein [Spirosoma utsteinense]MBC3783791.1 outer membrane protein OmpA-like peptidoglycan-associated protein [Spirosoma utsteinense]MBC3790065.1 outer membrane protein OmpA-like peptidoglycan-associated protein [Spirosoma utsteinense]
MKTNTLSALLVALCVAVSLTGCNSAMQAYKKGVRHYDAGEYNLALTQFQKASKGAIDPARLNYYTAESYRLSNRFGEAVPFYQKAIDANIAEPNARFNYAYALKSQGNYAGALEQLQQFVASAPKTTVKPVLDKAKREVETLRAIDAIAQNKSQINLRNMGNLNSTGSEFAPVVRGEELVFTASRKEQTYKNNGLPMLGLYKTKLNQNPDETGTSPAPEPFSTNVLQGDVNEGTPAFSKDGKTMILARGNNGKRKGGLDVDLYISRLGEGNAWSQPARLPISDSLAWDGSPAFSADGKTLYFASNRAGGAGGIDLYRTSIDASGRFSRPVNMGRDINTPGDEMFPYVAPNAKLYFASDGHPGLGKLDVFVATRSGGVTRVENMGQPINSPADDFGLIYTELTKGFLASNRSGGKGDDDIYFFQEGPARDTTTIAQNPPNAPKTVRYFIAGTVSVNETPVVPLDSARVRILDDATGQPIAEVTTGEAGTFGKYPLQEGKDYTILAERRGYLTRRESFTMQGKSIPQIFLTKPQTDTTFYVPLLLDKSLLNKTFVLENIYYDLDKYNIRADAAPELDKIVVILKDNPTLKLELSSHTDVRAPDAYNLRLSQNRAKSAVDYIVSQGVSADRLVAKGYGETQLVVKNAKTEEEHQRNRRTEIKILEL